MWRIKDEKMSGKIDKTSLPLQVTHCHCKITHKQTGMHGASQTSESFLSFPYTFMWNILPGITKKWDSYPVLHTITILTLDFSRMCWPPIMGTGLGGICGEDIIVSGSWVLLCGGCVCCFPCASFFWQNRTWLVQGMHAVIITDGFTCAWQKLDIFFSANSLYLV